MSSKASVRIRLIFPIVAVAVLGINALWAAWLIYRSPGGLGPAGSPVAFGFALFGIWALSPLLPGFLAINDEHVMAMTGFRPRRISWDQIESVALEPKTVDRRLMVVIKTTGGKKYTVQGLIGRHVDRALELLQTELTRHRSDHHLPL